jgi:hypothetical protein
MSKFFKGVFVAIFGVAAIAFLSSFIDNINDI